MRLINFPNSNSQRIDPDRSRLRIIWIIVQFSLPRSFLLSAVTQQCLRRVSPLYSERHLWYFVDFTGARIMYIFRVRSDLVDWITIRSDRRTGSWLHWPWPCHSACNRLRDAEACGAERNIFFYISFLFLLRITIVNIFAIYFCLEFFPFPYNAKIISLWSDASIEFLTLIRDFI